TEFYAGTAGVYRVDITYQNAAAGTNPPTATVSYYIPVGPPTGQTITFAQPAAHFTGESFQPGATASSGLPVTYSVVGGAATINGNTVTLTTAGSVTLRAAQAGGINNGTNWSAA